ncbi:MAG: hypothetical protein IJO99_05490 [Ruminococcus sp.]|nr:hypothetical protein [Ruminococcus sp.]MBQ9957001.1 hypothetical protein [Ruminococcus sp.]MBR6792124.1 hypothetical protein [Ruminococcus sp.]
MIKDILNQISSSLSSFGVNSVYTAFDNIPISKKESRYIVVSVDSFETASPIFSDLSIFLPYKAVAELSVIAPCTSSLAELYDYFDSKLLPLMDKLGSLTSALRGVSMKYDSNINRLVMKIQLSVSGISRIERSDV